MSDLEKRIAALSPEKIAALARRLNKGSDASSKQIAPRARSGHPIPLSFSQQRLWFLDQFEPGSAFYNIPMSFRVMGPYNVAALEQSLTEIVRRHEALRTTFSTVDGQPAQIIAPELPVAVPVVNLSGVPESQREAEAYRLMSEEGQRPFDLVRGPLFRATLLRLSEADHVLLLTMHHIIADAWSMGVLLKELSSLYEAFSSGRPSPLPELPIQYTDFAQWQREWLQGEVLNEHLSYWKQHLSGAPALLELPTDRPRPPVQVFEGAAIPFQFGAPMSQGLLALSQREGVTLFMTLLAAFNVLLYRYTGQRDLVVGAPIANRTRAELEGLIGFFTNTLALRTHVSGDMSFRELLQQVRETTLGAYGHQDLPFEKLVEELQPERNLSYNPLFQVMFVLQNVPVGPEPAQGGSNQDGSSPQTGTGTAKFDLTLFAAATAQGLTGTLEYNISLFDAGTIGRMIGHLYTLLAGILAQPDQRVSELPILTEAERQTLLVAWNNTQADYPANQCPHQLFEAQVERTPDAAALRFGDEVLSYAELNRRANRVAHRLRARGVGPEVVVGLCVERSVEMMVGLLGILKAGGAYVPLDPAYPKDRLSFMMDDTAMPVLVTQRQLADSLPPHRAEVCYLNDSFSEESDSNPSSGVTPENLVYIIYTSGSTGKPKGVAMQHGALTNMVYWQVQHFAAPPPARTLQFNSLNFDVSFQDSFSTWCSGGELVVVPEEERRDVDALLRRIISTRIERLFIPYVMLRQLAEVVGSAASELCLREVISTGEQLQMTRSIIDLFTKQKDCILRNHYGPTENHLSTEFTLTGPPSAWPALAPIGRPISNMQVYVLDAQLNPVPAGIQGDFYIGGVGMARGYFNRPDLTADKFIPDRFSGRPGDRLYRTGDLARFLPDGNIEFLGRVDDQVKIRGFRVELDELGGVLLQHPSIGGAVVTAREDKPGDKRLVAYLVPRPDVTISIAEVRSFLRAKLPEYMMPSSFMVLAALPLSPNRKVDRRALPPPDDSRRDLDERFIAPRTPIEESLAKIWTEILPVQRIGVDDNFFELGGHSLLATRVVSRVREVFHVELLLRRLFEAPTIGELARVIEVEKEKNPDLSKSASITRRSREAHRVKRSSIE